MVKEEALVDSGATENFMDERMVTWLEIECQTMEQPCWVFNVDETENKNEMLTHYCLLHIQKGNKENL